MRAFMPIGFAGILVLSAAAGCRDNGSSDNSTMDLSMTSTADLAKKTVQTTVREINTPSGPVKVNDRVSFDGVVVSPIMWVSATDNTTGSDYCNYRIAVMQADGSASTLRDGMVVSVDLKTTFAGDMSKVSACNTLGMQNAVVMAMDGLKIGDAVSVTGFLNSFGANGSRYVDSYNGFIKGNGQAAMMPQPVVVADPNMFAGASPLPQAFIDASGVLVKFQNVQVNSRNASFQDFTVATPGAAPADLGGTDMGIPDMAVTGGATIAANYLKVVVKGFMAPAVGMNLTSLTGVVFGDFGGKIWPRGSADIVP